MLKKLKTLLFLIIILILSFGINCVQFPEDVEFNNPVDPEAPNYVGIPSVDLDGDGISSYYDVDDITILSPADGTVTSDGTPTLVIYKFNPSLVKRYYIQVSTSENDFENNIVHENDNISSNYYAIPAGVLENHTTYYWCAKAYDGNKWSDDWSGIFSFTLDITTQVPTIPLPINNSTITDTTPVLDWEDVYDATRYHIQVNTAVDFNGTMIVDDDNVLQSSLSVTTILDNATTYYWRVKIKNGEVIWGDWSDTWSFIIQIKIPVNPLPPNGGSTFDTTPLLNWDDVTGVDGYDVQVAESDVGLESANIVEVTASEYQIESAYNYGETKYWRVRAVNEDGIAGAWGGPWQFEVIEPVTPINNELASHGLSMRVVMIISEETDTYRDMTLTRYALSETEVTQDDYAAVIRSNPASGYGVGDNYPVYYVTWYDAVQFCNTLSTLLGLEEVYNESTWEADFTKNGFYLPTEAQWEYAAGGPNHYTWPLGDTFNASDYVGDTQTQLVKSKPVNGFGLYDMGGNVYEWCNDWEGTIFPHTGETDPTGPVIGSYRIRRGGGWLGGSSIYLRCDFRRYYNPSLSRNNIGFRVAVGGHGNW